MSWYKSGSVTVTNGSTTVTGSGTDWVSGAAVGEGFYGPDGRVYEIAAITSSTGLTLGGAYLGATASAQAYQIIPSQSYIRDLAAAAAQLVADYAAVATNAGTGKFADGTVSAPGVRFVSDENTGFYRSGTDEVTFVANGVAQFKYSASSGVQFLTTAVDINGGTIDATVIGGTTPAAGSFTTVSATTVSAPGMGGSDAAVFGAGGTGAANGRVSIDGSSASSYGSQLLLKRNGTATAQIGQESGINGGTSNDLALYVGSGVNTNIYGGGVKTAIFSSTGLAVTGVINAESVLGTEGLTVGTSAQKLYFRADAAGVMVANGAVQTGEGIYFDNTNNKIKQMIGSAYVGEWTASGLAVTGKITAANGSGGVASASLADGNRSAVFDRTSGPGATAYQYNGTESGQIQAKSGGGLLFYQGSSPTLAATIDSTGLAVIGGLSATGSITSSAAPGGGSLKRDVDNSYLQVQGGTSGATGATLLLSGPSYAAPSAAYIDATTTTFRTLNGASDKMTLDASGNLGLGIAPSAWGSYGTYGIRAIEVGAYGAIENVNSIGGVSVLANAYNSGGNYVYRQSYFATRYTQSAGTHAWYTAPSGTAGSAITFTKAMTLDASGNLLVGTTSGACHMLEKSNSNECAARIVNSSATNPYGVNVRFSGVTGGTGQQFFTCSDDAERFRVLGNGNAQNQNNSYGAISDLKLKENITDATPKLAGLMQVRVVNYNLKTDPEHKQLGVIAQELEQVFPGLVEETPDRVEVTKTRTVEVPAVEEVLDDEGNVVTPAVEATTREEEYTETELTGEVTKSVKYSVFVPMLIKAMQEQQALIQSMAARLDALEGAK